MMSESPLTFEKIKAEAFRLGFSACGAAPAEALPQWRVEQRRKWLEEGCHGEMDYLDRNEDKRCDPRLLVEGAQTIVSLALNYCPSREFPSETYRLARYALGKDYHDVMKDKMRLLMANLGLSSPEDGRVFVDTAPVDEHYWAWRCGLGSLGRHTQLIIPKAGTYFFLGELVLTQSVAGLPPAPTYAPPLGSYSKTCLHCHRCVDACPTGALSLDQGLDARKCLSYLTIEKRGPLPSGIGQKMGDVIYGCDRCTEVCPHNVKAIPTNVIEFQPSIELLQMKLEDWKNLTIEEYQKLFRGSAVKRAKYEGLKRNISAVEGENPEALDGNT